jgi:hypothetical protein
MMLKTIHLDATLVASCAAIAAIIALMVVGSVPFSTLHSHLLAYVGAGLLLGIAGAVAFLILMDRVLFPALDRFLTWVERTDKERKAKAEAKKHCGCCIRKAKNPAL